MPGRRRRGRSLAGRAPPLHGGGPGFESPRLHRRADLWASTFYEMNDDPHAVRDAQGERTTTGVTARTTKNTSNQDELWEKIHRRAHGGCLGATGRRRTRPRGEMHRGDAGSLRSGGLRMGQPVRVMPDTRPSREGTGGTETSHVPRGTEKIPVVAASEPGGAETTPAHEAAAAAGVGLYET